MDGARDEVANSWLKAKLAQASLFCKSSVRTNVQGWNDLDMAPTWGVTIGRNMICDDKRFY